LTQGILATPFVRPKAAKTGKNGFFVVLYTLVIGLLATTFRTFLTHALAIASATIIRP
jgi:hypothetical protein